MTTLMIQWMNLEKCKTVMTYFSTLPSVERFNIPELMSLTEKEDKIIWRAICGEKVSLICKERAAIYAERDICVWRKGQPNCQKGEAMHAERVSHMQKWRYVKLNPL